MKSKILYAVAACVVVLVSVTLVNVLGISLGDIMPHPWDAVKLVFYKYPL